MSLDFYLYEPGECEHCGNPAARKRVFRANVTHNLGGMAKAVGLYRVCWHPEDLKITRAKDAIPLLEKGLAKLEKFGPKGLSAHEPENGWGSYDWLLKFTKATLAACKEHPDAEIEACT